VEVRALPCDNQLVARIQTSEISALGAIVTRLRSVFDLDANMAEIDKHLSGDARLRARVRARPGLRVPGAWDSFELAVRAVLGQQISVRAATTFAGRLVAALGQPLAKPANGLAEPHMLFPSPARIATADLTQIGLTRARSATLNALGAAVTRDPNLLQAAATLDETVKRLASLPGLGPWTAQYIAMRALREPDAFPASDLGVLRALETDGSRPSPKAALQLAEAWRPWRAYAVLRLWTQAPEASQKAPENVA
jgi:AraC family transcriptional regulator of adaptative response / DNA-3-methyladenine glycosylase II